MLEKAASHRRPHEHQQALIIMLISAANDVPGMHTRYKIWLVCTVTWRSEPKQPNKESSRSLEHDICVASSTTMVQTLFSVWNMKGWTAPHLVVLLAASSSLA